MFLKIVYNEKKKYNAIVEDLAKKNKRLLRKKERAAVNTNCET